MRRTLKKLICVPLVFLGRMPILGRPFRELARLFAGVYKDRRFLGALLGGPWISPRARVRVFGRMRCGRNVFVDDECVLFCEASTHQLRFGNDVSVYQRTTIHVGGEGSVEIGDNTHIQNDCQITAFGPVVIGSHVQIAPRCALYPYGHGFHDMTVPIREQPLTCKGGICIGDDAWLGYGVVVLDGVRIGKGAVIGAGSVVTRDIPDGAIAFGVPARVVARRGQDS